MDLMYKLAQKNGPVATVGQKHAIILLPVTLSNDHQFAKTLFYHGFINKFVTVTVKDSHHTLNIATLPGEILWHFSH